MEINTKRLDHEALLDLRLLEQRFQPELQSLVTDWESKQALTKLLANFYRAGMNRALTVMKNADDYQVEGEE